MGGSPNIVIVGCGVVGLSSALVLTQAGYEVTILAKEMPLENNIMYPSDWAGAGIGIASGAEGLRQRVNRESFLAYAKLFEEWPNCGIAKVTAETYFDDVPEEKKLWFKEFVANYRVLDKSEYPDIYQFGIAYDSYCCDPQIYLPQLYSRVRTLGVKIIRAELSALTEALTYVPSAKAIVNCSGYGAHYLSDVKDTDVYLDRGQTCVIRTEERKMITRVGAEYTYCIPRPISGFMVLGGINEPWNTSPEPNMATRQMFKERGYAIYPQLGRPEDMDFVKDIIGVRSSRKGGYRLEKEARDGLLIVHNYGHGGSGYGVSLGAGKEVLRLIQGLD